MLQKKKLFIYYNHQKLLNKLSEDPEPTKTAKIKI